MTTQHTSSTGIPPKTNKARPISMVLIGAGNRGRLIYGKYALDHPHRAKFLAVVEPQSEHRNSFAKAHEIPPEMCFESVSEFFDKHPKKIAEALIIATMEDLREEPALRSIQAGYAVLCEKPLATTPEVTMRITDHAKKHNGLFMVCHQMRYTPLYRSFKRLLNSGNYGRVISVEHSEYLSYWHMAHSFVRGINNNDRRSPMILSKSCHDMDLLLYVIDGRPKKVASFGSLTHFKPENTPEGAPKMCVDGCPHSTTCPYDAMRFYLERVNPIEYLHVPEVRDRSHLLEILRNSRYGRCVYQCDNNVVDHQVCAFEFENDVTATFSMIGHNEIGRRRTKLMMTDGELELDTSTNRIEARRFLTGEHTIVEPDAHTDIHSGGDKAIMDDFVQAILTGKDDFVLTSVAESLDSHLMAFAAEESRKTGKVIDIAEFEKNYRAAK